MQELLTFARRMLVDEQGTIASITRPVLLCEVRPNEDEEEVLWATRVTGSGVGRQRASTVFELRKKEQAFNAFTLGITVGRTDNNDVAVNDASLSRFHAYFLHDERGATWRVVDAESSNGTWVDGRRLGPNESATLQDDAMLQFGEVTMRFLTPEGFIRRLRRELGEA